MDPETLAGLKRKHATITEPAKKAELANMLRAVGHDPDAEAPVEAAPKTREVPTVQTTEQKRPAAITSSFMSGQPRAEATETAKETAAKAAPAKRRPGRPKKSEVTGSGGITSPSAT